jgi:hypothetical protein
VGVIVIGCISFDLGRIMMSCPSSFFPSVPPSAFAIRHLGSDILYAKLLDETLIRGYCKQISPLIGYLSGSDEPADRLRHPAVTPTDDPASLIDNEGCQRSMHQRGILDLRPQTFYWTHTTSL